jgi:hypothetical protein
MKLGGKGRIYVADSCHDYLSAGLGAGFMEAVFAVTPSETIKCAHFLLCGV